MSMDISLVKPADNLSGGDSVVKMPSERGCTPQPIVKLGNVISLFSEGNDISEGMRILLYHNVTDYLGNSQKLWKFSDCLSRVHAKEKALQKFNKKLAAKKEQADAEPEVIIHSLCYAAPRSVTWGDYLLIPLALYSTLGDYLLIPLALYLTGVIIHFRSPSAQR